MRAMARRPDPALGTRRELELAQGPLGCFEAGSGPPIVFVRFDKPALIAWSRDDRVFLPEHGEGLAREAGSYRAAP